MNFSPPKTARYILAFKASLRSFFDCLTKTEPFPRYKRAWLKYVKPLALTFYLSIMKYNL
ncbi:hypothetical protein X474_27710 [Dethiosulfatarculus sandiegensis]|uniref:Uncharacterized protein n=1 Tax=Dethiosulfatarculus sandiegensis TaxID=1429043 RepID=A0A0D2IXK6_9BACT|nr:hypothetical protein X474_27710 [Dethiosulfatarculus sandiegensis]